MTERIVDVLEAVEVEKEQRGGRAVAACAGQRLVEALLEMQPVRQAGQRILVGETPEFRFGILAVGDVEGDTDHAPRLPRLVHLDGTRGNQRVLPSGRT